MNVLKIERQFAYFKFLMIKTMNWGACQVVVMTILVNNSELSKEKGSVYTSKQ